MSPYPTDALGEPYNTTFKCERCGKIGWVHTVREWLKVLRGSCWHMRQKKDGTLCMCICSSCWNKIPVVVGKSSQFELAIKGWPLHILVGE